MMNKKNTLKYEEYFYIANSEFDGEFVTVYDDRGGICKGGIWSLTLNEYTEEMRKYYKYKLSQLNYLENNKIEETYEINNLCVSILE